MIFGKDKALVWQSAPTTGLTGQAGPGISNYAELVHEDIREPPGQWKMHHFPEEGSYQEFIEKCLLKNEPCLFGKWATSNWGARKRWVRSDGTPNFTSLVEQFGNQSILVPLKFTLSCFTGHVEGSCR